jgi:D-arabinan exo alpha-(1,3)/(1,5)-arabinofuranosidase (non-reducing end)
MNSALLRISLTFVLLGFCLFLTPLARGNSLDEITRKQEGRSMRWSTGIYDPESNRDAYRLRSGEKLTFCELEGPGEIQHIWFTIAAEDRRYPRSMVLRMYWDDSPTPSVESPMGDFFGAGNGMRVPVSTVPIEVTSYGRALNSYWRMPFNRKARLEIEYQGQGSAWVYCQVDWIKKDSLPPDTYYFHAQYYQESSPPPRFKTYTILDCTGEGNLAGVVLSTQNVFPGWFGEADDRYYIDGEIEPSLIGTGLEDYFTDAWNLRVYNNRNCGVTICEPNAEDSRKSMYRWHLDSKVMFRKSLKVEVERRSYINLKDKKTGEWLEWNFKYRPDYWSSVAYWYHKGIAPRWCELAPLEQRVNPEIWIETSNMVTEPGKGGIKTSDNIKGNALRRRGNRTCHQKKMTWMVNREVGTWMEVPFKVDKAGRYSISVFQSLKKDRGIWKVSMRGPGFEEVLDPRMDFFDSWLAMKENYPENEVYSTWHENKVGIHDLQPGDYILRFECVGSNPLSYDPKTQGPGYNLALDAISLRRMPIDDLYAWIDDYLKEEDALFAMRIGQAKKTVTELSVLAESYNSKYGKYPTSLDDLKKMKKGLVLPRDPWNQKYQYEQPGNFNPGSFDVYSWHGNSRDSAQWIGNWKMPYVIEGAIEGEDLKWLRGVSSNNQELSLRSIPPLSGNQQRFVKFEKQGDWAELEAAVTLKAGRYRVALSLAQAADYGIIRFALGGQSLGKPIDCFNQQLVRLTVQAGVVELKAGKPVLRLEAMGKNQQSDGFYAGIDALILTPLER